MLKTTVIGSFPQPDWLLDKAVLRGQRVSRVRQPGLWKVENATLDEAIEDATRLAVRDMENAGIDIVTDGEIGRESYSNHFLGGLEGIDFAVPASIKDRKGRDVLVPRVTGPVRRTSYIESRSAAFLKSIARNRTKVTLPGPFTMAQQCADTYYCDAEELAFAFAEAVNEEARDLAATGIDVVQIDEPWFRNDPEAAKRYGIRLVNRTLEGVGAATALHLCFGYGFLVPGSKPKAYDFLGELAESCVEQISVEAAQPELDLSVLRELNGKTIILGVLDLASNDIETVDSVVARIEAGLKVVEPALLMPAPDCGMKYLTREAAFGKLKALGDAVAIVRHRLCH